MVWLAAGAGGVAVEIPGSPGAEGDESELEESLERVIEFAASEVKCASHATSSEIGRASGIGGQGEQKDGGGVRSGAFEPAFMEETGFEPSDSRSGLARQGRMRRDGLLHELRSFLRVVARVRRRSARSRASLAR